MNFDECKLRLQELYNQIFDKENPQKYKTLEVEFNEVFLNLIKTSINEEIFFSGSTLKTYIIELENRLKTNEIKEIDFDEIEYIKMAYLFFYNLLQSKQYHVRKGEYFYISQLNNENYKMFCSILAKRINYLEELLFKKGVEIIKIKNNSIPELGWNGTWKISFKRNLKIIIENESRQQIQTIKTQTPKHENIFCNNGFELFAHILKEYVKTDRGRLTDIHFFYWSMYNNNPQLIHQRPERFKEWFFENYNEDLKFMKTSKTKTG
jgi:hypothetical protein